MQTPVRGRTDNTFLVGGESEVDVGERADAVGESADSDGALQLPGGTAARAELEAKFVPHASGLGSSAS